MKEHLDQLNRRIRLSGIPRRIVSLVPSQTELLVDLGLREQLVGITKFCVHPQGLRKEKEVVGGTKKVKPEKIRNLKPDIILCNKEENTKEMVAELEQIAPVHVSDVLSISDSLELISAYGELFGLERRAAELKSTISSEVNAFRESVKNGPRRRVAYLIWKRPWMAVGKDTFIDSLLQLNNFENMFSDKDSRYPETSLEEIKERQVELLLLSTEPFPFTEKHKKELQALLPEQRMAVVDGEYFSWYGSRLLGAVGYFRQLQKSL